MIKLEELLKESMISLEFMHNDISTSTEIGKAWFKLITSLETVVNEIEDFEGMYSSYLHGPLPSMRDAKYNLKFLMESLVKLKPTIIGMDDIQKKDMYSESKERFNQ